MAMYSYGRQDDDLMSETSVSVSHAGNRAQHTGKLIHLAKEIEDTEKRTKALEARNVWLTGKLMGLQKTFVRRVGIISGSSRKTIFFRAWADSMHHFRLEHALEDSNASLGECHQVARELGARLEEETLGRKRMSESHQGLRVEIQRVLASNQGLREDLQELNDHIGLMEERLRIAHAAARKIRGHAQNVPEMVNLFERNGKRFNLAVDDVRSGKLGLEDDVQSTSPSAKVAGFLASQPSMLKGAGAATPAGGGSPRSAAALKLGAPAAERAFPVKDHHHYHSERRASLQHQHGEKAQRRPSVLDPPMPMPHAPPAQPPVYAHQRSRQVSPSPELDRHHG
eukprot:TRINITY_DN32514_c0_g1_i1.p1 TRINITY_DN32514_c0_g1~~TRINITY_DN32514_c0_g1_i1.p1  ORF type:complete len:340 (+),score=57.59 TRINITY_DN32514_c0_g1_i1:109-1128(+)